MTTVPVQERMTADEFLSIPYGELPRFSELVDGEVIVNEASPHHSVVQGNLYYAFRRWMSASPGRGQVFTPIDVAMDERNVFGPDLSWYSARNSLDLDSPGPSGRPDLVAEVRSPSTWRYDIGAKKTTYERLGLPELWLVDTPAEEVLVFAVRRPAARAPPCARARAGRGARVAAPARIPVGPGRAVRPDLRDSPPPSLHTICGVGASRRTAQTRTVSTPGVAAS